MLPEKHKEEVSDLPELNCEWWYDGVDLTYGTMCNKSYNEFYEYCPNCQNRVELIGCDEDDGEADVGYENDFG